MADTTLNVKLEDQTRAGKIKVIRSLDDIKKAARGAGDSVDKLDDELDDVGRTASTTAFKVDNAADRFDKLKRSVGGARKGLGGLQAAVGGVAAALGAQQIVSYADAWTNATNQLRIVTGSTDELVATQEGLFDIAQETRSSLEGTVDLYAKLARTTDELGLSQGQLFQITTTVNQAIQASGAPAASAEAALVQLGQGLAAGALRGEELNSVMEQTPRLARAIADGMGITIAQLREFGAEGALTAETVTQALLSQGGAVRSEFLKTEQTVGAAFTNLGNALTRAVGKINEATGATGLITRALNALSDALDNDDSAPTGSVRARTRARDLAAGGTAGAEPNELDLAVAAITSGRSRGGRRRGSADRRADLASSTAFDQRTDAMQGAQSENAFLAQARREQAAAARAQTGEDLRAAAFAFTPDEMSATDPLDDIDITDVKQKVAEIIDTSFLDTIQEQFDANDYFNDELLGNQAQMTRSARDRFTAEQQLYAQQLKTKGLTEEQIETLVQSREDVFEYNEALATQDAAIQAGVMALSQFNETAGRLAQAGADIYKAFTVGDPASQIMAVAGGLLTLTDSLFGMDDSAEKARQAVADLNRELERADRSAQNVIEDLFDDQISAGREQIFKVFEDLFTRLSAEPTVNIGNAQFVDDLPDTQADAVRKLFDFLANFDAIGVSETLENFEVSRSMSQRRLVGAIEASFGSFDEFEQLFLQTFGDTGSFNEIATAFFDSSDAFDHLRESATKATEATRGLTDEQERATRLQFAAEEQAARLELSERARQAGGDSFLQRRNLDDFLSTFDSIVRSRDLALSRSGGVGASGGLSASIDGASASDGSTGASTSTTGADVSADMFASVPSALEISNQLNNLGFGDNLRDGIAQALENVRYTIELAQHIDFDLAGVRDAINRAVEEAMYDRQFDQPTGNRRMTS